LQTNMIYSQYVGVQAAFGYESFLQLSLAFVAVIGPAMAMALIDTFGTHLPSVSCARPFILAVLVVVGIAYVSCFAALPILSERYPTYTRDVLLTTVQHAVVLLFFLQSLCSFLTLAQVCSPVKGKLFEYVCRRMVMILERTRDNLIVFMIAFTSFIISLLIVPHYLQKWLLIYARHRFFQKATLPRFLVCVVVLFVCIEIFLLLWPYTSTLSIGLGAKVRGEDLAVFNTSLTPPPNLYFER